MARRTRAADCPDHIHRWQSPRSGKVYYTFQRHRGTTKASERHPMVLPDGRRPQPGSAEFDELYASFLNAPPPRRAVEQEPPPKIGVIYFIGTSKAVKIGFTNNVPARLRHMQTSAPDRLDVLATMPGTKAQENSIQHQFNADRIHGEWFAKSDDLTAYIEGIRHEHGVPDPNPKEPCRTGVRRNRRRFREMQETDQ